MIIGEENMAVQGIHDFSFLKSISGGMAWVVINLPTLLSV